MCIRDRCSNRVEATADGKMSAVSSADNVAEAFNDAARKLRLLIGAQKDADSWINYYENSDDTVFERFWDEIQLTIFFGDLIKSITVAVGRRQFLSIPLRIVDALLQWFAYVYLLLYPFVLVAAFGIIIQCY